MTTERTKLEVELKTRTRIHTEAMEEFITAADWKEKARHKLAVVRNKLSDLNRAEFEEKQEAAIKPTRRGMAASIEKIFGTQGLELVERALAEKEEK